MGFTIYYTSTRAVSAAEADQLRAAAEVAGTGRTWLSSEPVHFFGTSHSGELIGGSKPNPFPHPDEAREANVSGLPDGTPRDVIDILARLSREHAVDWHVTHDYGDMGYIRAGVPDPALLEQIDALKEMDAMLGGLDDKELDDIWDEVEGEDNPR